MGAVTNMKYKLGKKSPDDLLNHGIINKMDEAFNLLEEKMQKAAQAVEVTMKQSYAEVVQKLHSKIEETQSPRLQITMPTRMQI